MNCVSPSALPRILVAEDQPINQMLMRDALTRQGFDVAVASDGNEAVELVRRSVSDSRPFAMIFMDLVMPHLDGIAATKAVRSLGIDAVHLPILAVTSSATEPAECRAAGMQGTLQKPVKIRTLQRAVQRWSKAARYARELDSQEAARRNYENRKAELATLLLTVVEDAEPSPIWSDEIADVLQCVAGAASYFDDLALGRVTDRLVASFRIADTPARLIAGARRAIDLLEPLGLEFHGRLEGRNWWRESS